MGFSRQKYCRGLPFSPPEDLPDPGIDPSSLTSPAFADGFFTTSATWKAIYYALVQAEESESEVAQSCLTLSDSMDCSPPGSPVPGILQARTLEWVAISFSQCMKVKSESEVAKLCPTLSDSMDCSLPGSSVHGIFQARVLEWAAITTFS